MSNLFDTIEANLKQADKRIVFPEGYDGRILAAADRLSNAGILTPILLGNAHDIKQKADEAGANISQCELLNPNDAADFDEMVEVFVDRRKGKVTADEAKIILRDENYFGTMLVHMGKADGLVSGAAHSTADTVRPALQIIKTKEGIKKTSGVFIMVRGDEKYVFADCAINMSPDSQDLAEIAVESANTAKLFDVDPRIAMLSFSTKGSAQSEETEKVVGALNLAKEKSASLVIDGEFQFDAAFVPDVAAKKHPTPCCRATLMSLFSQAWKRATSVTKLPSVSAASRQSAQFCKD